MEKDRIMDEYYRTKLGTLYHGDCLEVMKNLDDKSIDLTVTSPPYDNLRTYDDIIWNEDIWKEVIRNLFRITKEGGVVVWVVGDATIKGSETGTSFKQALFFKECGFNLHDTMIWEKTGQGAVGSIYCYWQNFEYMFVFSKGKPKSINLIEDRRNIFTQSKYVQGSRGKDGISKSRKMLKHNEFGRRFNIWTIVPNNTYLNHPAMFPEQLARDHIISWSQEKDVVFDPFVGSGTTILCALQLNRKFAGIELSEKYCKIAKDRIEKWSNQERLEKWGF